MRKKLAPIASIAAVAAALTLLAAPAGAAVGSPAPPPGHPAQVPTPPPLTPEEAEKHDEQASVTQAAEAWMSCARLWRNYYLNWKQPDSVGYYDFVALYDHVPADGDDAGKNYLPGQWQWATKGTNWYTGVSNTTEGLTAAYVSWDYGAGKWKVLDTSSTRWWC
ncbi:hypothetical protein ACFSKW_28235 [Nonomuraea mangrovi]|uniref:Secreted protein n=1 Tax=Nonomuraea mangrovi TaxID=2316207 RepID=A0ABW4T0V6_9ACTN